MAGLGEGMAGLRVGSGGLGVGVAVLFNGMAGLRLGSGVLRVGLAGLGESMPVLRLGSGGLDESMPVLRVGSGELGVGMAVLPRGTPVPFERPAMPSPSTPALPRGLVTPPRRVASRSIIPGTCNNRHRDRRKSTRGGTKRGPGQLFPYESAKTTHPAPPGRSLQERQGSSMSSGTKQARVAHDQGLIAGINKRFTTASLIIDGQTCNAAALVAPLTQRVTSGNGVIADRAALIAAEKADVALAASTAVFVSSIVEAVYAAFANDAGALADFQLLPRKKPSMTPAQKLAASEKAKATRAARHTMGPKQKLLVTGSTPAATATATAPAAASSAGTSAAVVAATNPVIPATPHS
jgi:hypothetical protein